MILVSCIPNCRAFYVGIDTGFLQSFVVSLSVERSEFMPKNRIIPFGYCMKNGEIITEPKEVYAVVTIFNEYLKGKSLLEIAALMEVPYSENSSWNKNMVKRIIENDRYLGTEKYPQIIDKETFKLANEKRVRKATVSIGHTEEVKLLKQITFCKECGQKLTRTKENLWDCRRPECYRFDHLLTDQIILYNKT